MSKSKNVTAAEVTEFMERLYAVRDECLDITKSLTTCRIDTIPDAYEVAKALISASSNLAECANRFLNRHDFQMMEKETERLREKVKSERNRQ